MGEREKQKSGLGKWIMRDPTIKLSVIMVRLTYGGAVRIADALARGRAERAHDNIVTRRARRIGRK